MGAFDRFRNLEGRRPERDGGPDKTTEGVAEHFGQPDMPPDAAEAAPIRCLKCAGENPALSPSCFNCGAELDTAEVRANQVLERAGRIADFLEFAELMVRDALQREESCGGHFREEYQTPDGEALRNDMDFSYVSAWEFSGTGAEPRLHKEPLVFEEVHPSTRSYK